MVYLNHGEALEWDMQHLWGYDINNPDLSVRKLWNFYYRLPDTSETKQDVASIPRDARSWDPHMYMYANIIDVIQAMDWHLLSAFSKHTPKTPKPFERPKLVTQKKQVNWPGKTIVSPRKGD